MSQLQHNTISHLPGDAEVESRARVRFRDACGHVDSYHALRLGLARRKALDARRAHFGARLWAPLAGGAVACCALAVSLAFLHPFAASQPATPAATSQPIVASAVGSPEAAVELDNGQVEMVQNLDFYRWLATQPSGTAAASSGSAH